MPLDVGVWRLGKSIERLQTAGMERESELEDAIVADLSLLGPGLLLVGRQVPTNHGKFIDILAIDNEGTLHVVELKRNRTPRDVVAQVLDYGSWVKDLTFERVSEIFASRNEGRPFEAAFAEAFGEAPSDELEFRHRLVIVATDLDASTERIIRYLTESYGVPVNAVFFRAFVDVTRSWFIDPNAADANVERAGGARTTDPWNGRDFYVSVGENDFRNWDDWRAYGFVSGGGGKWYSQTLRLLEPGARVFACIPGHGYVGVGVVREPMTPFRDFRVRHGDRTLRVDKVPHQAARAYRDDPNPETAEYFVGIDWRKSVPRDAAYWEKGLFAKQHTACRLRSRFTIERVLRHFQVADDA